MLKIESKLNITMLQNIRVDNPTKSVSLSLTMLRLVGFWPPENLTMKERMVYNCYAFLMFMILLGTYIIIQLVDLHMVWGNIPLMTGTAFLLFTNLSHAAKFLNLVLRRDRIQTILAGSSQVLMSQESLEGKQIVKNCNRETSLHQLLYFMLTTITVTGWVSSAEKNQLPMRAWYPYDTSKSPAYELTYVHQIGALYIAASLNVSKDTLVTALLAQCRCRLQILGLELRTLCRGLGGDKLLPFHEDTVNQRLRSCVRQHQEALETIQLLQHSFTEPTFAQFAVSLVIICVTAFQMTSLTGNIVRLISMGTYLMNMMFQVFLYCYQGTHLAEESQDISQSAYECPWYSFSTSLRGVLLFMMTRCRRPAKVTAGGYITLSLASFTAIIKTSYSLFTLLQQINE